MRLASSTILCTAASLLVSCRNTVLDPKGPIGRADATIMIDSLAIMLAIIVPTIIAILAFAWWYRASNQRAKHLPEWSFSGRIELVVWSIPTMVVILLGGVAWIGSHELDPAKPLGATKPFEIQVVSLDWKWLFIYPDEGIASLNSLTVPAATPLHLSLTSASVLNAFFIPQLGSMIYTMNGMTTQLNLQVDAPQTLRGLSSHYSGEGFSDMHFAVNALAPAQFSDWVAHVRGGGGVLDAGTYAKLKAPSIDDKPAEFGKIDPKLFAQISMAQMLPESASTNSAATPGNIRQREVKQEH